jgi:hypothetical protein
MDGCEQPELADLAEGNRERGADRLFCPVLGGEALDGTPEVDGGHGRPGDIFGDRAHVVEAVGLCDDDVDLGQSEFDGETHTPGAVDYCESAVFFGHGRRLDDADDLDGGL